MYQISHNTRPFYSPLYFYYLVTHSVTHVTFKKLYNFVRSFFNKYFTIPNMYILDSTNDINTVIDSTIPNVSVPKKWTFHKNLQLLYSSSLIIFTILFTVFPIIMRLIPYSIFYRLICREIREIRMRSRCNVFEFKFASAPRVRVSWIINRMRAQVCQNGHATILAL